MKHVHPMVMQYVPCLFKGVFRLLAEYDVQLYAMQVSGLTCGDLFWPRVHVDDDFTFMVLVCIDYGCGPIAGGDFAFVSVGHVRARFSSSRLVGTS